MTNYEWLIGQGIGALMDWRSKTCSHCASLNAAGHCDGDSCRSGIEAWLEAEYIEPDTQERINDDATMPPRRYYAEKIGHDVDLKDDEEVFTAVALSLLRRQRELDARTMGGDAS